MPHESLNHYSKGAVISFLHRYTAGIELLEPAYRRFRVRPRPGGGLTSAEAAHESPYGRIEASWRLAGDRFDLEVTVPAGTSAEIVLPDGTIQNAGPVTMSSPLSPPEVVHVTGRGCRAADGDDAFFAESPFSQRVSTEFTPHREPQPRSGVRLSNHRRSAGNQGAERGARTRFHHSESPTATATSNPPAPANHDAMSTCLFATVTWLGRSPSASCSWSALSAL